MTGDVAGGQEHRETNRQGGQKGHQDLFDALLHCAEILVFFCSVRILRILRIFLLEHGFSRSVTEFYSSASVFFRVFRVVCFIRTRSLTDFHGVLFTCIRLIRVIRTVLSVHQHPCNPCDPYRFFRCFSR